MINVRFLSLTAAASIALTATASMAGTPEQRFTRDGQTYVYTTITTASGRRVIEGRVLPANAPFRLVIRDQRVNGTVDGRPVSFRVAEATDAMQLAAK